jgi:hypothetical protein
MPGGFGYTRAGGKLAWRRLDRAGRPAGESFYPQQFDPTALLAAGLVSPAEFADCTDRTRPGDGGGCGAYASGSGCDGDGGDGGDGGGGCGGGCGGD